MRISIKNKLTAFLLLSLGLMINEFNLKGYRKLSVNLGGGKCKWTLPQPLGRNASVFGTLLASYPASGMRLLWQLLEGLTGVSVGDDYYFIEPEASERTGLMKTQYPHLEGTWGWGDKMDQIVLLVRNPRFAISSYHTILYEISYAPDKEYAKQFYRKVFTGRPPMSNWIRWRDRWFTDQIKVWGWYIDYWMEGGMRYWMVENEYRNGQWPYHWLEGDHEGERQIDEHCISDMNGCYPQTVISYERLRNETTGPAELNKVAKVLEGKTGMTVIEEEARECVWNEVMNVDNPLISPRNEDRGGSSLDYGYTPAQMLLIRDKLIEYRDKYSSGTWVNNPLAKDLVSYFVEYLIQVNDEIDLMAASPTPTMAPNPYYEKELRDWYAVISRGDRYRQEKAVAMTGALPPFEHLYDEDGNIPE
mmetsp:Transcript_44592/g.65595  ORF Transcript_44592/g.65595 Transcript_44592/m.65595 type:complete len:418 (-) Transcript_44592:214-1467(-)|eukprot:CAMPEP_0195517382 /NCGR_PEP_ID=MMETSP0794_2-20130614/10634_1 /TAXON_ID=515487 /ORGANISM="Stephanopyxis turris, Strain CCMP 815" /LENGTH=417 /DNA_ID=CAMNT_0040646179 /DNA_START=37 /DNA_END=1290 /DNA_ORIENTATION=-